MIAGARSFRRIAFVKPCCIGDCVMALPALDALRQAFPTAAITVYVGTHSRAVFEIPPRYVRVRTCPETFNWQSAIRLAWRLQRSDFEAIFVMDRSRLLRLAARAGTRGSVYAALSLDPETRHEADVYLDVVRNAGIDASAAYPHLQARQIHTNLRTSVDRPYAVIHPGGGSNPGSVMPSKRWGVEHWSSLAAALHSRGMHIVLTGSAREHDLAATLADRLSGHATILAGKLTLAETIDVVAGAEIFAGPDTGMSHISAALSVPTVAIFGPTNPHRYRPLGRYVEVCAAPGSWTVPDRDLRSPRPTHPASSVELVKVTDVIAACDRLLARRVRP